MARGAEVMSSGRRNLKAAHDVAPRPGRQVMPPLTPLERAALKSAIERGNQIEPIVIDETGEIVDGYSRFDIAQELGIPCPTRVVHFADEAAKIRYAYESNIARRQLEPLRWGLAFSDYLEACGVRRGSGRQLAKTATVAAFAKEWGVSERTARDRLALADRFRELPEFLRATVAPDEGDVRDQLHAQWVKSIQWNALSEDVRARVAAGDTTLEEAVAQAQAARLKEEAKQKRRRRDAARKTRQAAQEEHRRRQEERRRAEAPWFEVLAVRRGAPRDEVKAAYRRLVQATHPDHGGDAAKFRRVQAAWERYEDECPGDGTAATACDGDAEREQELHEEMVAALVAVLRPLLMRARAEGFGDQFGSMATEAVYHAVMTLVREAA
jgi:hypothetical protein